MKTNMLAAILVLSFAGTAAAATVDFRDAVFGGANNQLSFSTTAIDGNTVTLTAMPAWARLSWNSNDGLGVRFSYENDEIEGPERLRIGFLTPVHLSSVLLTDLFYEGYAERGSYRLNGTGSWINFTADPSQTPGTDGLLALPIDPSIFVSSILFRAPGYLPFLNQRHEFSVAALEVNAVPIPAAAWLLGSGLIGLVALRRRKT